MITNDFKSLLLIVYGSSYNEIRIICTTIDFQVRIAMVTLKHHLYALVKSVDYMISLAEVQSFN